MENKVDLVEHIEEARSLFADDFRRIPSFDLIIENWKYLMSRANSKKEQPAKSTYKNHEAEETYTHVIVFPNGNEFEFEWDIVRAVQWFEKRNVQKTNLLIDPLLPYMVKNETPFDDPNKKTHQHSIIVISSCMMGQELVIINGNHRIKEANWQNQKAIAGFYLRNDRHREWMLSEEMIFYYEFLMDFKQLEIASLSISDGMPFENELFYNKLQIAKRMHDIGSV